jgi:hypothetical protein
LAQHRYKVGQLVDFSPARGGMPVSALQYEVVRQLPPEGGELLYRVKSRGEVFERIARESELSRRSLD